MLKNMVVNGLDSSRSESIRSYQFVFVCSFEVRGHGGLDFEEAEEAVVRPPEPGQAAIARR